MNRRPGIQVDPDLADRPGERILHIVGDSKFGGGSIVIIRLAEMAKHQGWRVEVLTTDATFQRALKKNGIGAVPLNCIWRSISPVRDLVGLFRLWSFLRQGRYTLAHTHTSKAGIIGRLAARLARVPIVIHTVHGFAFHEESSRSAVWTYAFIERIAAHVADRVVTVSNFHRDWALKLGIGNTQNLVSIPNGILPKRAESSRPREQIRDVMGLRTAEFVVLSIGRLAPQKGLEYLIDSIRLLSKRGLPPFRLLIVGDGPLLPLLKARSRELSVESKVEFLGFQNDVGALLKAADLVVLPSLREGLSIALLEAMAASKPIVTTTIGSNLEVTAGGAVALIVPPKNSIALADAISELMRDPAKATRLGEAARQRFLDYYTEDRMLNSYRELYKQLIAEKSR